MLLKIAENVQSSKQDKDYHKGVVVDNKDPKKLGRVKALVEGRLEVPVDQYDRLPWIAPDRGSETGGREDVGSSRVPPIQSEIKVRFLDDSPYNGYYSGSIESKEHVNDTLFTDNYPNVSGQMNTDGSWTRSDHEEGYTEDFHPQGNRYGKTYKDGSADYNFDKDIYVRVGGKLLVDVEDLHIVCGDLTISGSTLTAFLTAAINMKGSTFNREATGTINDKASSHNTSASSISRNGQIADNGGGSASSANVSLANTAKEDIEDRAAELQETLETLSKNAEAIQESSREYNRGLVTKGIANINAEPTLGTTENSTKTVADYSFSGGFGKLFDLNSLSGNKLLGSILKAVPQLQQAMSTVQNAAQNIKQLTDIQSQVQHFESLASTFVPGDVTSALNKISAVEDVLDRIGNVTGVSPVEAIAGNRAELDTLLSEMQASVDFLDQTQNIRNMLPQLTQQLDLVPADASYGNDVLQQDLVNRLNNVQPITIPGFSDLKKRAQSAAEVATIATSYQDAHEQITAIQAQDSPDPIDLKIAKAKITGVSRQITP